ncbi:hypothetical protein ACVIW2_000076 [Bradyrhizobium huanghuaihaiense]
MTTNIDTVDVCCVALELSKTSWVCAFAVPGDNKATAHKIKARDVRVPLPLPSFPHTPLTWFGKAFSPNRAFNRPDISTVTPPRLH